MKRPAAKPPYSEGDQVRLLHMCGQETHLANVTVVTVKPHTSSAWSLTAAWVVVVAACDNHPIAVTVDARGRDVNGYLLPVLARAS